MALQDAFFDRRGDFLAAVAGEFVLVDLFPCVACLLVFTLESDLPCAHDLENAALQHVVSTIDAVQLALMAIERHVEDGFHQLTASSAASTFGWQASQNFSLSGSSESITVHWQLLQSSWKTPSVSPSS